MSQDLSWQRVCSFFALFLLCSCSEGREFRLELGKSFVLKCSGQHEVTVNSADQQYIELQNWLKINQNKWQESPASYVPGTIIKGKGFHLNLIVGFAVLNSKDGQFIRKIDEKSSIEKLLCLSK